MRSMSRSPYRPTPVMNVTPLVDVVLVLLIIFMVVIPAMEKSAKVELPGIFNPDPEGKSKTDPYTLSLTADGQMFFEDKPLEPDAFLTTLREANDADISRRLMLRADTKAKYGKVRELFAACQEVGFPGVSLRVNEIKVPGAK